MASTFELSDEQPHCEPRSRGRTEQKTTPQTRAKSVPRYGTSYDHLFGPATPAIVRRLRRIEQVAIYVEYRCDVNLQGKENGRKAVSKKSLPGELRYIFLHANGIAGNPITQIWKQFGSGWRTFF